MEAAVQALWASHQECCTCYAARPKTITNGEGDVILGTDVQNLIPVSVCKVLYVLQQAQLQHNIILSQTPLLSSKKTTRRKKEDKPLLGVVYDEMHSKPNLPILQCPLTVECQLPGPMVNCYDSWSNSHDSRSLSDTVGQFPMFVTCLVMFKQKKDPCFYTHLTQE